LHGKPDIAAQSIHLRASRSLRSLVQNPLRVAPIGEGRDAGTGSGWHGGEE